MANKWQYIPLCEAVDIYDYLRKPVNRNERDNLVQGKLPTELCPYYGATGQVGFIDNYIIEGEYVLLGEDGAPFLDPFASKAYLIAGKAWVNNHAHILKSKANNKFLCYYLNQFDFKGYVSGTTRLKLTQAQMRHIPVPNPPVAEQERIVSDIEEQLSKLDNGAETLNKVEQQLGVYRQAVLKEAFSCISKSDYAPLKTAILGTPQNGLYKPKSTYGIGYPILRIDGFYDGSIVRDYSYKRLSLSPEEAEKYRLNEGDLLINRVNSMSYLGKCALVHKLPESTVFESNIMRISLDSKKVRGDYITYYLSSLEGKRELLKNAKQAVNQASINQTDVGNVNVPIPDLNTQDRIVSNVNMMLSICEIVEQTVIVVQNQAKAMRQSILKQAFGEGL